MKLKIKGPYDPVEEVHSNTVGPSMTQQQFKDECDVNNILRKYSEYGHLDHVNRAQPRYMDCSSISAHTFQEHLDFMMDFEDHFDSLPEEIRKRFDDDPSLMMEFLSDERNHEEAMRIGILKGEAPVVEPQRSEGEAPEASPEVSDS